MKALAVGGRQPQRVGGDAVISRRISRSLGFASEMICGGRVVLLFVRRVRPERSR
jgi:hypothetical protein